MLARLAHSGTYLFLRRRAFLVLLPLSSLAPVFKDGVSTPCAHISDAAGNHCAYGEQLHSRTCLPLHADAEQRRGANGTQRRMP